MKFEELTLHEQGLVLESMPEALMRKFYAQNPSYSREFKGFRPGKEPLDKLIQFFLNLISKQKNFAAIEFCEIYIGEVKMVLKNGIDEKRKMGLSELESIQLTANEILKPKYQSVFLKLCDIEIDSSAVMELDGKKKFVNFLIDEHLKEKGIDASISSLESKVSEFANNKKIADESNRQIINKIESNKKNIEKNTSNLNVEVSCLNSKVSDLQRNQEKYALDNEVRKDLNKIESRIKECEETIKRLSDENGKLKKSLKEYQDSFGMNGTLLNEHETKINQLMDENSKKMNSTLLEYRSYIEHISKQSDEEESEKDLLIVLFEIIGDMVQPKHVSSFKYFLANVIYSKRPILSDVADGNTLGLILANVFSDGERDIIYCDVNTTNEDLLLRLNEIAARDEGMHVVVINGIYGKIDISLTLHYAIQLLNLKLIFTINDYRYLKFMSFSSIEKDFIFFKGRFIKCESDYSYHIKFSEAIQIDNHELAKNLEPFHIVTVPKIYFNNLESLLLFSYIPLISEYQGIDEIDVIAMLRDESLVRKLEDLLHE
jgi:hypothetical protein